MKDKQARQDIEILRQRFADFLRSSAYAPVIEDCPVCKRRTAMEKLRVIKRWKTETYRIMNESIYELHVQHNNGMERGCSDPARRCLSCDTVFRLSAVTILDKIATENREE